MTNSSPIALQPGYELHWYRIERVLGQGAFGITYLARDINLDREVAIKEYLPGQFSTRDSDLTVKPTTAEQKEDFDWGLKRFISEARTLTMFEHPNLVRVFNVFEVNGTAYMVMNYEQGKSLQQVLKTRKTLREEEVNRVLIPLMNGLELMHEKGFVHRDIKPGNIFMRGDGSPVLLDFGSARQTRATPGRDGHEDPQTLTTLVSPGYAPIEQYGSKSDRQGPWTDIYGLGATAYRAITGVMPIPAVDRSESIVHDSKDPYLPLSEAFKDRCSPRFLAAIDHALAFRADDRPQSIEAWRREFDFRVEGPEGSLETETETEKHESGTVKLSGDDDKTLALDNSSEANTLKTGATPGSEAKTEVLDNTSPGNRRKTLFAIAGGIVIVLLLGFLYLGNDHDASTPMSSDTKVAPANVAPEPSMAEQLTIIEEPPGPVEPQPGATPEPAGTDEKTAKQIEELHRLAKEDIKALRLTSPKDNNAFDKYLTILKLDENNDAAQEGIVAISNRYVALAYGAINKGKLANAESYLNKAEVITPGSTKIPPARQALADKRAAMASAPQSESTPEQSAEEVAASEPSAEPAEEPNESFWNRVKDWHKDNLEKNEQYRQKTGETTEDKVKKALGGD